MKAADFIETALAVKGIEVTRVARCELTCLQIAATQVCIAKCFRTLAREKMKAQPASIHARNSLSFSEEGNEQKQNQIGIDLRLELQIACKIFRSDLANSALELKRRMQGMIKFFAEHDQGPDVAVAYTCAGIVQLELFNQPARIINPDVKLISGPSQKCPCKLAQFARGSSSQD